MSSSFRYYAYMSSDIPSLSATYTQDYTLHTCRCSWNCIGRICAIISKYFRTRSDENRCWIRPPINSSFLTTSTHLSVSMTVAKWPPFESSLLWRRITTINWTFSLLQPTISWISVNMSFYCKISWNIQGLLQMVLLMMRIISSKALTQHLNYSKFFCVWVS